MAAELRRRLTSGLVFGLFVMAVGLLFFLQGLDVLRARDYFSYWAVFPIALGVFQILEGRSTAQTVAGGAMVLIGAGFLVDALGYFRFSLWQLLFPCALLLVGVHLVAQSLRSRAAAQSPVDDSVVNAIAVLSGVQRRVHATHFRGGSVTAVLGGCVLDLRQTTLDGAEPAVIDVTAFWGGVKIFVPREWLVTSSVVPLLGGMEDKTETPKDPTAKRLALRGLVVMSGVEVFN